MKEGSLLRPVMATMVLLAFSSNAWAYLDPGSASLILQGLIAGLLSAAAVTKLYWHKLKQFFSGKKATEDDANKPGTE